MGINDKFIFIAAGSFQGKSLIALKLAAKFNFSGVLTTDMIRNIYTVNNIGNDIYSTSTYLMEKKDLEEQKEVVSETLLKVIDIYKMRGEKMIFEGMHFSNKFIKTIKDTPYFKLFLNNNSTPKDRFIYKAITRNKFSVNQANKNEVQYEDTMYYKYESCMIKIHENLKYICLKNGFIEVEYTTIEEAVSKCEKMVNEYLIK